MEIVVTVIMSSHVYRFCGRYFLQADGGPIGLRSTACLASMIIKLWHKVWTQLLDREGLTWYEYFRYVDDSRTFCPPLSAGWYWDRQQFTFCEQRYTEDMSDTKTDDERTTTELTKAMSSLVDYLVFEGEHGGMFHDNKLPTLETSIWWDGVYVKYQFFEKSTCPNHVIQRDTALSTDSIRSSLVQEVVRRLIHCSDDLDLETKCEILSKFGTKLVNSGHLLESSKMILVHGVVKFLDMVRRSILPQSDPKFKPLHVGRHFKKFEMKLLKFLSKSGWYNDESGLIVKSNWRMNLPTE